MQGCGKVAQQAWHLLPSTAAAIADSDCGSTLTVRALGCRDHRQVVLGSRRGRGLKEYLKVDLDAVVVWGKME
jgi:hypothetical protein